MSSLMEPENRPGSPGVAPGPGPRGEGRGRLDSGWTWMALACVLIGATGVAREYQNRRIGAEKSAVEPCPFPLDEIPTRIGDWDSSPEDDLKLDAETVRITGSSDHVLRTYVDRMTGVKLSALILFGPAEPVLPHTPQACYPAGGYAEEPGPSEAAIPLAGRSARFRKAIYTRAGGGRVDRARVYHSFRLDGDWSPDVGDGRKFHRSNPGIFKVQIQRPIRAGEQAARNEPVEDFLGALLPEIERRIAAGSAGRDGPAPR